VRAFAKPTPIGRLSPEARVVYSVFCVFMLVGYFTSVWFYLDDDLGVGAQGAQTYYLGEQTPAPAAPVVDDGGPALDLPGMDLPEALPTTTQLRLEKPARQIMETFHFHLFSVSVCLLILGHIFMMCGLGRGLKNSILIIGSLATLLHILVPPLIRFTSPHFAALMFPSALIMGLTWLVMTAWPLWEMWRPRAAADA
jgi:hypothetical protein